jgi:predicted dehydrogenase
MKPLRVGLIGTGMIMRDAHMFAWPALRDAGRVELVAACDIRPEVLDAFAKQYNITKTYGDHREMLRKEDLDVVDIATPNACHAEIAINAFKAGCHVYCEKPLAPTPAEIRSMIKARDKAGKLLMTGQHLRFDGRMAAMKRYINTGILGDVYYTRAAWIRRRGAPVWGGFLSKKISAGGPGIDIGVHVLDLSMWMMDFPKPVSVTGIAPQKLVKQDYVVNRPDLGGWREKGLVFDVEDFVAAFIRFDNGAALSLEASWLLNTVDEEVMQCSLFGTRGGADCWKSKIVTQEHGVMRVSELANVPAPKPHAAAIIAYIDCLEKGTPVPVPPEESLVVISILDGIYKSYAKGGEVKINVEMPDRPRKKSRK